MKTKLKVIFIAVLLIVESFGNRNETVHQNSEEKGRKVLKSFRIKNI